MYDTRAVLSEAYGGEAMKNSSVFELHKRFEESLRNVEDALSHSRSQRIAENVEELWNLAHLDRLLSTRAVAVQLNLDKETEKNARTSAQQLDSPP
jgi:hypothetical protein